MDANINGLDAIDLVNKQLVEKLAKLEGEDMGTAEREALYRDIERLKNLKIDLERHDMKIDEHINEQARLAESEIDRHEADVRERKLEIRRFVVNTALKGAEIAVPACIYATFLRRGFDFETTGIYRSKTLGDLIRRLPKMTRVTK